MRTIIGENYYDGIKAELILTHKDENVFIRLEDFLIKYKHETKLFFISYDLKNKIENLSSNNKDQTQFPLLHCIVPNKILPKEKFENSNPTKNSTFNFKPEFNKQEYIAKIKKIKHHIQQGDIYETNFCYSWSTNQKLENSFVLYQRLKALTQAPFSVYAELKDHIILSVSPERFIKKRGNQLISEPIKGTAKRKNAKAADQAQIKLLASDPKERAENIMIVDLVRNDLSKVAIKNSVSVKELCRIYSFKNIHQMISKVTCKVSEDVSFSTILKALFPMGSMTGVPKIRSMKLMDTYEETQRGLYSGSIGVMQPNGDFDLNVVIRTIIYNKSKESLSFSVGGAITIDSSPEKEYQETLTKAEALLKACQ